MLRPDLEGSARVVMESGLAPRVVVEAVMVSVTKSGCVFFDLCPGSNDGTHIHPLVFVRGFRQKQCVCCQE